MTTDAGLDFRIRNVQCDMSLDTTDDFTRMKYGKNVHKDLKVPSIRMFGICENGEKCLANIHGYLPYFYFRTRSPFSPELKAYIGKMIVRIVQLLEIVLTPGNPLLADVVPTEYKDFYGFHPEKDYFVKVLFFDPILCHRVGLALQKECGKCEILQPYQVHIPYLLQFFIEYDIVGMGICRFRNVRFRRISADMESKYPDYLRHPVMPNSYMANEIDVFCDDIIVEKSPSMQSEYQISGLESLWKEEESRCRIQNQELKRPDRPETGVPEIPTEREDMNLKNLGKIFNELLTGDPNCSQVISDQRSDFSETEAILDEVDKAELSVYVQSAIKDETEDNPLEKSGRPQYGEEVEEGPSDQAIQLEMTQLATFVADEPPPVHESDDESTEIADFDERCEEIEAHYSAVLLEPSHEEDMESSTHSDYPNPRSNETWCPDTIPIKPKTRITVSQSGSPIKMTEAQKAASEKLKNVCSVANLTVLSVEALFLCNQDTVDEESDKASDKKYIPDPLKDPCIGIFFTIYKDICNKFNTADEIGGCIVQTINFKSIDFPTIKRVKNEGDLFRWLGALLRKHDPDIIVGYDIKRLSFNYIMQRASVLRIPSFNVDVSRLAPRWDNDYRTTLDDCKGRIFLNTWKIVRRENPMRHYRMSAVVQEILNRKFADLSQFFIEKLLKDNDENVNSVILRHFLRKVSLNIQILVELDIFIRTSQMALVYGIQFTEVLTRGSQFRVESMLLRLAKIHDFCAPSVSIQQRNAMPSPETIPLNMEPRSGIYYDPVVVLDFQSLYPSVCIAYNYCFSTCLGTVEEWQHFLKNKSGQLQLGALTFEPPVFEYLAKLRKQNMIHISPVGGIFVKKEIRKSLVASMLEELLETRVMVKTAMKKYKDEVLKRLLNARQLALKLIANVTYGYTAANWSGRMPCPEVADAIVSKGREALERAIKLIEEDADGAYHGSQVVYGDTDSLFILMPGLSKEDAFRIGRKIADDVTALNPYPMKLKFEKVMMPCCLLAKKRYVGLSYEEEKDVEGVFDAKGIETVRRDSCKFVATSMEVILRKIFDYDFHGVMNYLQYIVLNIEKIPLHEFILSGDYRGDYSENAVLPVKKIAEQLEKIGGPLHVPVHGDRIEFLVAEPPASRKMATVFSCVFRLDKFYELPELRIHYTYYINRKLLPALSRIFQLIPLKVHWFSNTTELCLGCGLQGELWCSSCVKDPRSLLNALKAVSRSEKAFVDCSRICRGCIKAHPTYYLNVPCYNVNCAVWQRRYQIQVQTFCLPDQIKAHPYHGVVRHITLPNIIE